MKNWYKLFSLVMLLITSTAWGGDEPEMANAKAEFVPLNDTGIGATRYSNFQTDYFFQSKDVRNFPGQDPDYGRDAASRNGNDEDQDNFGFDFSGGGDCVTDNVTGLMWEVKEDPSEQTINSNKWTFLWQDDQASKGKVVEMETVSEKKEDDFSNHRGNVENKTGHQTILDSIERLNPYRPDNNSIQSNMDAEKSVQPLCGSAKGEHYCTTQNYIHLMNEQGLCGYDDWRLPTREELRSIVHYGTQKPSIDKSYFPNTVSSAYWTSTQDISNRFSVWVINFEDGGDNTHEKHRAAPIRLVRTARNNEPDNKKESKHNDEQGLFTPITDPIKNLWNKVF